MRKLTESERSDAEDGITVFVNALHGLRDAYHDIKPYVDRDPEIMQNLIDELNDSMISGEDRKEMGKFVSATGKEPRKKKRNGVSDADKLDIYAVTTAAFQFAIDFESLDNRLAEEQNSEAYTELCSNVYKELGSEKLDALIGFLRDVGDPDVRCPK